MENNKLVSIIILTYNNFDYIFEALDSVLSQSYSEIELIINDDNSKYFDKERLVSYINTNKKENIKNYVINQNERNMGTVKNFNRAISLSNGQYIFPLACDDCFYNNDVVKSIVTYLQNTDALLATSYRWVYDQKLKNKIELLPNEKDIQYLYKDVNEIYYRLCIGNFISGASTYYKREFFNKYGMFDEKYILLEDFPKYLNVTRKGCRIGFIDIPTIKYRIGGVSTSPNINLFLANDDIKAIEEEILPYTKKIDLSLFFLKRMHSKKWLRRTKCSKEIAIIKDYNLYEKIRINIKYLDLIPLKVIEKIFFINKKLKKR